MHESYCFTLYRSVEAHKFVSLHLHERSEIKLDGNIYIFFYAKLEKGR